MAEPREQGWHTVIWAVVTAVACLIVVTLASIIIASFQGHARAVDLVKVEIESKQRDSSITERFDTHRDRAEREWRKQASFRGAVAAKMGIELPPED